LVKAVYTRATQFLVYNNYMFLRTIKQSNNDLYEKYTNVLNMFVLKIYLVLKVDYLLKRNF